MTFFFVDMQHEEMAKELLAEREARVALEDQMARITQQVSYPLVRLLTQRTTVCLCVHLSVEARHWADDVWLSSGGMQNDEVNTKILAEKRARVALAVEVVRLKQQVSYQH
jgi:hypothetical protein